MQRFRTVSGDMLEGIRAKFVVKDNRPRWSPPTLGDVDEGLVDKFFESLGQYDLKLERQLIAFIFVVDKRKCFEPYTTF